jgi:nucleoside-diphosphate-sugar epimerase
VARILVTGAAGFIGTALCPALVSRGHRIVAGLRRDAALPAGIKAFGIEKLVLGDLGPGTDWTAAVRGADIIIHLAQRAHAGPDPPVPEGEPMVVGMLARAAAAAGAQRLVLLSSIKAMGETTAPGRPFRADDLPRPEDAYGRTKLASERAAASVPGIELVVIRPPLVYGAGVRANFRALIRLAGSGAPLPFAGVDNRRSLIFRDNLVHLIILAATHPAAAGQRLLARDIDISTPALIRSLAVAQGRQPRLFRIPAALLALLCRAPGIGAPLSRLTRSLVVDDAATRELLDWSPPIAAEDALAVTARAFAAGL